MNKYLILVIALIMVISTAGCTSLPGSNRAGPARFTFQMMWQSNSSFSVPLSSFNLSNASLSNLIYAKIHAKLTIDNNTANNDAKIIISKDKFHLDFLVPYFTESYDKKMVKNDKVYDFILTMVIESQDPAVSGLKLIGEDNKIQGNFTLHDYDMGRFDFNITAPHNYTYYRSDSRSKWGEVTIDLRSGQLLKFGLDPIVY
jgi:hypothetical protein